MKQLIFTLILTLYSMTLPSAPTPHTLKAVGLDVGAADTKVSAAQTAGAAATTGNGEVDHKVANEVQNFDPETFLYSYTHSTARIAALKRLMPKGLNLNKQGVYGFTLLNRAVRIDDFPTFEFLILAGVDLDLPDPDGITPAYLAANNCKLAMLYALTKAGANLEVQKEPVEGRTALQIALIGRSTRLSPIIISLIEVTTQNIEYEISHGNPRMITEEIARSHQYIGIGLHYRAQYRTRLAQQLALIQNVVVVPEIAQLIHKLVGRQIFSLEHVKALIAAHTS